MAIPAIAGIGWLGALIGGIVSTLLGTVAQRLAWRIAAVGLVIALVVALTGAFYVAIEAILDQIAPATPPQFSAAMGLFIPSNANVCVSAVLSAYVLRWLYDWQVRIVEYKLQAK